MGWLYPDLMNIYGDRGNVLTLLKRASWRGMQARVLDLGKGVTRGIEEVDVFFFGGGQDKEQALVYDDLLESKAVPLAEALHRGAAVLAVCGGYQLLGHSYTLGSEEIAGVGLLDVHTVREEGPRLIGNIAIEVDLGGDRMPEKVLAGFENHGGRTHLGAGQPSLGRVLRGHGNDGRSGLEGAIKGNTLGTYLHGPLLPKNVWFADWLIARALGLGAGELAALPDELERAAHVSALRAAGV